MSRRAINLAGAAACAGMMGFALYVQHGLGLEPCPLCVLQRIATISLGLVFLVAAGVMLVIVAGLGATVSARQVWLQNLPPDQVPACGPGFDYIMDVFPLGEALAMVFEGSGECAEVVWRFLGLSMPAWVFVCLVVLGLGGLIFNWRTPRAASAA